MELPTSEETTGDRTKNIFELSNRIGEGNQRIQRHAKKAILCLGNTGAGKSTLCCSLTCKKLLSVMEEETCELRIASAEAQDDVIGHYLASETKIPNMFLADDLVLWDSPGFEDTDPVQEIANRFYIKRLFEITDQMKFLLVVPEPDLRSKRGKDFLDTISNVIKMFKNVECILDSISLVVTKITKRKTVLNIQNAIQGILTTNQAVTPMHVKLIEKMLPSLYLFHEPEEAGETIELPGLLESIDLSGKYLSVNEEMVTVDISKPGKELSSSLLEVARLNFYLIVQTIAEAVFDAANCITVNTQNSFCKNHSQIKEWVPKAVHFDGQEQVKTENFVELELLSKLLKVIPGTGTADISEGIKIFQSVLEVFCEFAEFNSGLRLQIQHYGYCLQQQHEYVKFFSTICKAEQSDYSVVYSRLTECHEKTKANLESAVVNLNIDEENTDQSYYHRAIMFLNDYQGSEECRKHLAVAYKCLGIITQQNDRPNALIYFIKSVKANRQQPEIYEKMGELFTTVGLYSQAIECYKVINNVFMIKSCYNMWLKEKKNHPEIMMDRAEYFESIGLLGEAEKYYAYASGLSRDEDLKAAALEKWGKIMINTANRGREDLIERAGKKDFYNFSTVDEAFIENLTKTIDLKN